MTNVTQEPSGRTSKFDTFTYHSPEQLRNMSLAEIEALWGLVPTERQRQYKMVYDRYIRSEGAASSDAEELIAIEQIVDEFYTGNFTIPVMPNGEHWVKVPEQVRLAAMTEAEIVAR